MKENNIIAIEWQPYSPNLNPIEQLCWVIGMMVSKRYVQYNNYSGVLEEWEGICKAVKTCWRAIPGSLIKALIMSMPRQMPACK